MSNKTKTCPYCGEDILSVAVKCKHCGSNLTSNGFSIHSLDYGVFLLAIPIVAALLIWFWVGNMNLLESPTNSLALIVVLTIAGTAVIASMEASKVGMKSDREKGTYSPIAWFFMIALFWVIGYPVYLFKRNRYGLANQLVGGIIVAFVFIGSIVIMYISIEHQKNQTMDMFMNLQQQLEGLISGKPSLDIAKYVGQGPSDLLKEPLIEKKFKALVGKNYDRFFDSLSVSSGIKEIGDYYFASGCAPHVCGIEEGAFAIHKATGNVFAALLVDGEEVKSFGVSSTRDFPEPLYDWYKKYVPAERVSVNDVQTKSDVGSVDLTKTTMSPHPQHENWLQLRATLINRANVPVKWPLLEVSLFDSEGKLLAKRNYLYGEYLELAPPNDPNVRFDFMPGEGEAKQVRLNITGVDARAVGYKVRLVSARK